MRQDRFQWGLLGFGAILAVGLMALDLSGASVDDTSTRIEPSIKVTFSSARAHHPCCCLFDDGTMDVIDDHGACESDGGQCVAMEQCTAEDSDRLFTPERR